MWIRFRYRKNKIEIKYSTGHPEQLQETINHKNEQGIIEGSTMKYNTITTRCCVPVTSVKLGLWIASCLNTIKRTLNSSYWNKKVIIGAYFRLIVMLIHSRSVTVVWIKSFLQLWNNDTFKNISFETHNALSLAYHTLYSLTW